MSQSGTFGPFHLDEKARILYRSGKEVSVQPRVFDLLVYLYRNRDRIVPKEEILDNLWPDVVVTDASLQRAVSLLRGTLRDGGLEGVVRNYARQGYRFCAEAALPRTEKDAILGKNQSFTETAYDLLEEGQWEDAAMAFENADKRAPLTGRDLEAWAHALHCLGRLKDSSEPLERAAQFWNENGDVKSVARVCIILARIELEAGRIQIAEAWLSQAASNLKDLPICEESGHLEWMSARVGTVTGKLDDTASHAQKAIDIGDHLNLPILRALGLLYLGISYQAQGYARKGMQLQDEAAAVVIAGNAPPLLGGLVYCGLISGCANCEDWKRASRWTESFNNWCQRQGIDTFSGTCSLNRAKVVMVRGDFEEAVAEISRNRDALATSAPWAVGESNRIMGDIHLLRNEFDLAEMEYRHAHSNGWDPNPGYSLLLYARNQPEAAIRSLQRAIATENWSAGERCIHYGSTLVEIASAIGELDLAKNIVKRLREGLGPNRIGGLPGIASRAFGAFYLAQNNYPEAVHYFTDAISSLQDADSPLETERTRIQLALSLSLDGDSQAAKLECSLAKSYFEHLGARFFLNQIAEVEKSINSQQELKSKP